MDHCGSMGTALGVLLPEKAIVYRVLSFLDYRSEAVTCGEGADDIAIMADLEVVTELPWDMNRMPFLNEYLNEILYQGSMELGRD